MFRQFDESPEGEFYVVPSFAIHIDDGASAAVSGR